MATSYAPGQPGAVQDAFREVMASVCTPVSVVTAMSGDLPHGTTVSAFASLSMNPPMMVVSLDLGSELLAVVRRTGHFGVNVLGSGQSALARTFARKGGATKFAGVPWEIDAGVPRILGAGGFLVCRVARLVPGGDHVIVLGDVLDARAAQGQPLTYHARGFGTHVALEGQVA
jgi:flavin reductase (DIM6/NTAB) family NADH-FMN oxidoreductase RutF